MTIAVLTATARLTAQSDTTDHAVVRGVVLDTLRKPARRAIVNLIVLRTESDTTRGSPHQYWYQVDMDSTDSNGRFQFTEREPGLYRVDAYAVWMEGETNSLTVRRGNDTVSVEIAMSVRFHSDTPRNVRAANLAQLASAKTRWAARRVRDYRLTVEISCFCFGGMEGPATLEFRNDSLVRVRSRRGTHGPEVLPWLTEYSVPKMFAAVEEEIRSLERTVRSVSYDATYGFPASVDTDTAYMYTDSWHRWRVTNFVPLR